MVERHKGIFLNLEIFPNSSFHSFCRNLVVRTWIDILTNTVTPELRPILRSCHIEQQSDIYSAQVHEYCSLGSIIEGLWRDKNSIAIWSATATGTCGKFHQFHLRKFFVQKSFFGSFFKVMFWIWQKICTKNLWIQRWWNWHLLACQPTLLLVCHGLD